MFVNPSFSVFINLASYKDSKEDNLKVDSKHDKVLESDEINNNAWYKGTPITDRRKSAPNVYDPFERQNYLRSFEKESEEATERNNSFYYPNYVPNN